MLVREYHNLSPTALKVSRLRAGILHIVKLYKQELTSSVIEVVLFTFEFRQKQKTHPKRELLFTLKRQRGDFAWQTLIVLGSAILFYPLLRDSRRIRVGFLERNAPTQSIKDINGNSCFNIPPIEGFCGTRLVDIKLACSSKY